MGKQPKRTYRRIYLAEWLKATGHDQGEIAKAAEVDPSYISNIVAGRKPNPSARVLLAISEYLGITINDLYHRPPSQTELAAVGKLSPAAREALLKRKT